MFVSTGTRTQVWVAVLYHNPQCHVDLDGWRITLQMHIKKKNPSSLIYKSNNNNKSHTCVLKMDAREDLKFSSFFQKHLVKGYGLVFSLRHGTFEQSSRFSCFIAPETFWLKWVLRIMGWCSPSSVRLCLKQERSKLLLCGKKHLSEPYTILNAHVKVSHLFTFIGVCVQVIALRSL